MISRVAILLVSTILIVATKLFETSTVPLATKSIVKAVAVLSIFTDTTLPFIADKLASSMSKVLEVTAKSIEPTLECNVVIVELVKSSVPAESPL